jgi:cytochrome c biogenesis protein CcmG/thiol:disulfide interchange protein DsbE
VSESSSTSELTAAGSETVSVGPKRSRGSKHGVRSIATIAGLLMVVVVFALSVAPPSTHAEAYSPLVGHQSPAVTGIDIAGPGFNLGAQDGHFVVVDFFASWCVPCRTEQPQLVKFAEEQRNGATLLGIVFLDTTAAVRSLLGPWNGLYPVITDPGGRVALNFPVVNPPFKYAIDPKGIVVAKIIGPVTAEELDSIVLRAMAQGL